MEKSLSYVVDYIVYVYNMAIEAGVCRKQMSKKQKNDTPCMYTGCTDTHTAHTHTYSHMHTV